MNDHNLDDLIIDNIEPNNSKAKSLLTIIALFIVFLIVGIILAKSYTNQSDSASLTLEENNADLIAPELKLQAPAKIEKIKEETSLSSIIEEKIKAPEAEAKKQIVTAKHLDIPKTKPEPKPEKPVKKKVKETVKITEEFTQIPQPKKTLRPSAKITETNTDTKPVAETYKAATEKPIKTAVIPKKIPQAAAVIYYIQVGSYRQSPSTRFLSVIKKSGFNYTITKATSKGIKKLLIGPYPTRSAVDSALIQVRDRINKSAFVVKK